MTIVSAGELLTAPEASNLFDNISSVSINYPPSKKSNQGTMAVCIKPIYGHWNRALWLVEFIEFYKLLGASHFVFHDFSLGNDVRRVLLSYMSKGEVTVLK